MGIDEVSGQDPEEVERIMCTEGTSDRTLSSFEEQGQAASRTSVSPRGRPMDRARSAITVRSWPSTSASATKRLARACFDVGISDPATMSPLFLSKRTITKGGKPTFSRVRIFDAV